MIPREKIDEIIAATDIVALVGQYVTLKRSGKSLKGLCPFHNEKTPSFMVNPDRGFYKCFGCGEGGGAIQFLMKVEGLEFQEAVKILAQRAGVTIETTPAQQKIYSDKEILRKIMNLAVKFYQKTLLNSPLGKEAREYLTGRGLNMKTIAEYALGYAPEGGDSLLRHLAAMKISYQQMERAGLVRQKGGGWFDYFRGRIIFPIADSQGRFIGMGGRGMRPDAVPKYLNTPESLIFSKGKNLYGLHLAKASVRSEEEAFVVEGYMDAISLYGGGIKNVVASMGTALTAEQAREIARYTSRVIFAYDADAAGAAATVRGIEIFEEAGLSVKVMSLPAGEDPDSIIRKKGSNIFLEAAQKSRSIVDYKIENLRKSLDLKTPEGKEEFVGKISPILKSIKGDIRRSEYIRVISERTHIPEEIFRRMVAVRKTRKMAADLSPILKKRKLTPPERLLAYLMEDPGFIPLCRGYDFDERHMPADLLQIYRGLLREDTAGMEVVRADLISRIAVNEEILKKAVDLSMIEGLPPCSEELIGVILREIEKHGVVEPTIDRLKQIVQRKLSEGSLLPGDPDFAQLQSLLRQTKK